MGTGESKPDWQQDYFSTSPTTANPKFIKHKVTNQKCELISLPVIQQDQPRYIERITSRKTNQTSKFITPLLDWQLKNERALCGSKQQLDLVFGEVSPTLEDFMRFRQVAHLSFTQEQILYIIHNVAYGLKDIQNMKQQHGQVDLSSICVTSDVYLKDNLLLEEQTKLIVKRKSIKQVEGFPSPQKLRAYYDSLSSFEEMRGDLFSLGMVALQLYYSREDIKALYLNPDPRYRNYKINLQLLSEKIRAIPHYRLRHAIEILTNMQSKKRLEIFELLKEIRIDSSRLAMLRQNITIGEAEYGKNVSLGTDRSSFKTIGSENREINKAFEYVKPQFINYSPPQQIKSEHSSPNSGIKFQRYSENYKRNQIQIPKPYFRSNYYPSTIGSQGHPTEYLNQATNPEMYTSSLFATSKPLFSTDESKLTSVYTSYKIPSLNKDINQLPPSLNQDINYAPSSQNRIDLTYYPSTEKTNELTYVSSSIEKAPIELSSKSYEVSGRKQLYTHVPTFQQILEKVRQNNPDSMLNKIDQTTTSINKVNQGGNYRYLVEGISPTLKSPEKKTSAEELAISSSAFERRNLVIQNQPYIPRSATVAGAESIYHDEIKQNEKKLPASQILIEQENLLQSISQAAKPQNLEQSPAENENKPEEKPQIQSFEGAKQKKLDDQAQGIINAATSTVSAIPEENQSQMHHSRDSRQIRYSGGSSSMRQSVGSRNLPQQQEGHFAEQIPFFNGEFSEPPRSRNAQEKESYRSIGSISSDPRIVVVEPIDMEPSSPLRQGAVFVTEEYEVGTKYQGYMLDGMRHGKGKFYYKEGSYYDGQWRNNKMHGFGTLYYPNGTIAYEGQWKNDQFDGKGKVFNDQQRMIDGPFDYTDFNQLDDEWIKYQGDLKSDAKEGFGRLFLTNGDIYEGEFYKDMVHGVGKYKSDKSEKKGIWQHGRLKKLL